MFVFAKTLQEFSLFLQLLVSFLKTKIFLSTRIEMKTVFFIFAKSENHAKMRLFSRNFVSRKFLRKFSCSWKFKLIFSFSRTFSLQFSLCKNFCINFRYFRIFSYNFFDRENKFSRNFRENTRTEIFVSTLLSSLYKASNCFRNKLTFVYKRA
jgi:hypothetical protein